MLKRAQRKMFTSLPPTTTTSKLILDMQVVRSANTVYGSLQGLNLAHLPRLRFGAVPMPPIPLPFWKGAEP